MIYTALRAVRFTVLSLGAASPSWVTVTHWLAN